MIALHLQPAVTAKKIRFLLNFKSNIDLSHNKEIALSDLSLHCTLQVIKDFNNNKFKISAPKWDKEFD